MGKMQKKKPVQVKKKTQGPGESATGTIQADLSAMPVTRNDEAPSGEKKLKPAPVIPKRSVSEQTALMKFIDRYFGKWIQFLREVKVELTRVTWPSRKETIGTTAVVIVFVFVISIFLGVIDLSLSSLIRLIL